MTMNVVANSSVSWPLYAFLRYAAVDPTFWGRSGLDAVSLINDAPEPEFDCRVALSGHSIVVDESGTLYSGFITRVAISSIDGSNQLATYTITSGAPLSANTLSSALYAYKNTGSATELINLFAAHNVVFTGSTGDDYFEGGQLGDTLNGGTGHDSLAGMGGNDTINGGAGDDWISGGSGDNILIGGDGDDFIIAGDGANTVDPGKGDDTVVLGSGTNTVMGSAGTDVIDGTAGGYDTLDYSQSKSAIKVQLTSFEGEPILSGGDAEGDNAFGIEQYVGSKSNDVFIGDGTGRTFVGGDGADTFYGSYFTEEFHGSYILGIYSGYVGGDIYIGGNGIDVVVFQHGGSIDLADTGIENVIAKSLGWVINPSYGSVHDLSHVYGNELSNRIEVGAGDDVVIGQGGADTLLGGSGVDTVDYTTSDDGVRVDLNVIGPQKSFGHANGDRLKDFENINGSEYGDYLRGNKLRNDISGNIGNDTLLGEGGNDYLYGGNGDDILIGGAGFDYLDGAEGFDRASYATSRAGVYVDLSQGVAKGGDATGDTLSSIEWLIGSSYGDVLAGNSESNSLTGNAGNDVLRGWAGQDVLDGGAGRDTLEGGAGSDILTGGTGSDTFLFSPGFGRDEVTDFRPGTTEDVLKFTGFSGLATYMDVRTKVSDVGGNAEVNLGNGDVIVLIGVLASQLTARDFLL